MKYDLVIKNGVVVDGTGAPPFRADIGIKGDTIAKIGSIDPHESEYVIDASGLVVAPGFIDIHNHSDISIIAIPTADNYVLQGVTTIVIGNCGFSPAPITELNKDFIAEFFKPYFQDIKPRWSSFGEYLDFLSELDMSVNVVPLVGHGAIRGAILGLENVRPSSRELEEMKELLEDALRSGAWGFSAGLIYIPGVFADRYELTELAKVASRYGAIYAVHMRNEGLKLLESVMESLQICEDSLVPLEISHLKAFGIPSWGLVSTVLKIIENYISRGYDVGADVYPYTASSTSLSALLPPWVREGGSRKLLERLSDPDTVDRIVHEIESRGFSDGRFIEWSQIVIALSPKHKEFEGLSLDRIARELGLDPVHAMIKMLIDDEALTKVILFGMCEEDVEKAVSSPYTSIGSDGRIRRFGVGKPHPRNYGTFPRVIAEYVRRRRVLTLPEAVRKMTSLPARRLGLWDRGIIRPGMKADLTIFNYYTVRDTATYENPHSYPVGIEYVIVNGEVVVENGRHTGARPGRLLRRRD